VAEQSILQSYISAGWSLIRIPPLAKGPRESNWPEVDYPPDSFGPEHNVGIKLGARSGYLVDIDLDCDEALELAPRYLPETATFGRASKPRSHWLYRCNTKTRRPTRTQVELRSTGLQTVFPGSVHESGEPIGWTPDCPFPVEIEEADLVKAFGKLAAAALIARLVGPLQEMRLVHDTVLALAGILWAEGWSEEDACELLLPAFEVGGGPDSGHREGAIRTTFENVEKERTGWTRFEELVGPTDARALKRVLAMTHSESRAAEALRSEYAQNDDGNAQRLADLYGEDIMHVAGMGWFAWNGRRWESAPLGPWREATEVSRMLMEQGKATGGPGGEALERWGRTTGNVARIEAMIKSASKHPRISVDPEDLDSDPWLFNCQNGTVDLRAGTLKAHDREDRITKISPAHYDPTAECPRFDRFLQEVFAGDRSLSSYMLRLLGYCLTGEIREQALSLWHGPNGANGKSTLIELVMEIMGDYAGTVAPDLLLDTGTQHPTGLMDLKGKRLVVASELEEGKRWRESLVKRITGGDRIKARLMRQDFVEFDPTHKLVVIVNAKPIVRGTGRSFWRRMHLVPWLVSFEGREERDLAKKLRAEMSGVLRYMVAGCMLWQRQGLRPPDTMLEAGEDYRQSQDVIGQFLEANTEAKIDGFVNRSELYQRFRMWGQMRGEYTVPASAFYRMIEERGHPAHKRNGVRDSWA
jgi:putative DNA primase/helicase